MSIITLLTDFGTADSYVAEVKGVLLSRAPGVTLVDVSHDVPAGSVRAAQYLLARTWSRFPAGTVHLVVVDPGVGTERRALAAQAGAHHFVGPDNGLFTVLPDDARFVALPVLRDAAPTFHARDVFAPAAARLATGARLDELGTAVSRVHRLPVPMPRVSDTAVVGEVVYVDRFGNLVTNIPQEVVRIGAGVRVGEVATGPLRRTFGDVGSGKLVAYVGSGGAVEIAVRDGSATAVLEVRVGALVSVDRGPRA
jgi:hypothetical protein